MKIFDIFLGRLDGWHASPVAHSASAETLSQWLANGYRIETEHRVGLYLYAVYLIKA